MVKIVLFSDSLQYILGLYTPLESSVTPFVPSVIQVFVGGLPWETSSDALQEHFTEVTYHPLASSDFIAPSTPLSTLKDANTCVFTDLSPPGFPAS